jgi:hypothetical protein
MVRDSSQREPGRRCIIFIYHKDVLFEFVIHISLLVTYYSYYIKKHLVNREHVLTRELEKIENAVFPEIEQECKFILETISTIYNYELMQIEISNIPLPDVSTKNKDSGTTIVFNAIFADTEL